MFNKIKGLLLDLDGVFYIENNIIEGSKEALDYLNKNDIPYKFVTNTSTKSRKSIFNKLNKIGIPAKEEEIISSVYATVKYLEKLNNPTCYLLLSEDAKTEFSNFKQSETPEFIIVGDIGNNWNYEIINKIFRMIMNGSKLISLHKGKYWQGENDLNVDLGFFISGWEYTTGIKSQIIGKPSKSFFTSSLEELNLPPNETAMIGDDLDSDIKGSQDNGLKGILVRTGKFREEVFKNSNIKPDIIIDSIKDIRKVFIS